MPSVTGANGNNTTVGSNSGAANVTGSCNTFLGYDSGKNANGVGLLTNTAVGHSSLLNMIECDDNTAVGHASLVALSTGNRNTALGKASGGGVTTGTNNTFVGFNTASTSGSVANSTAIGNGASVDASNMIQLGNASVTQVRTSGTITAAAPTIGAHLTTKTYVDDKFTTLSNQNLKTTDVVTFGGLNLPTIGGTAATLSHYEEYVHNTVFSSGSMVQTFNPRSLSIFVTSWQGSHLLDDQLAHLQCTFTAEVTMKLQ